MQKPSILGTPLPPEEADKVAVVLAAELAQVLARGTDLQPAAAIGAGFFHRVQAEQSAQCVNSVHGSPRFQFRVVRGPSDHTALGSDL